MNHTDDHQELLIRFGNNLSALRISKNLSVEELAFKSTIELKEIQNIENGSVNPSLTLLVDLAKGLNITLPELLELLFDFKQ